jgi:hypothetical protein
MHAGDRLLAYALGKPTTFESPEVGEVKQTLIVRARPSGLAAFKSFLKLSVADTSPSK